MVPFEICRFEMQAELAVTQNGPGTSVGFKLRWEPTKSHVGMEYDTLCTATAPGQPQHGTNRYPIDATKWTGDVSTVYGEDNHVQKILLLDSMRNHSKMMTEGDDVGAYGIAWKPHDGLVRRSDDDPLPFWDILSMQTPGRFTGRLNAELATSESSVAVTAFRTGGGTGHITWDGYDPFGPGWSDANDGMIITVYNVPASSGYIYQGAIGATAYCQWNMRESKYYIYQMECPDVLGETFKDQLYLD